MKKHALLIGNDVFNSSALFPDLSFSSEYAQKMALLLKQGCYHRVVSVLNKNSITIKDLIIKCMADLDPQQDTLLLYFTGQVYLDIHEQLWLCTADPYHKYLCTTGIRFDWIKGLVKHFDLQNVIMVLDCCHSGATLVPYQEHHAFDQSLKNSGGLCLLASSIEMLDDKNYEELGHGVFTHYLMEGIIHGHANVGDNGIMTVNDVYRYAEQKMKEHVKQRTLIEVMGKGHLPFAAMSQLLYPSNTSQSHLTVNTEVLEDLMPVTPYLPTREKPTSNDGNPNIQSHTEIVKGIPVPRMIKIPAGRFMMGALPTDDEASISEYPQHEVSLKSFYLGVTTVTFEQYDIFCEKTEKEKPSDSGWGRGDRPVINVSWADAKEYIEWLNGITKRQYRLPSEAEWEYACRAGSITKYYWGETPSGAHANGNEQRGWPENGYQQQTAPVASFIANEFGLYDMSGNVWEWCEDVWHEYYVNAPVDGSARGGFFFGDRVLRGGSWKNLPRGLRSSYRDGWSFGPGFNTNGFRLAQDAVI